MNLFVSLAILPILLDLAVGGTINIKCLNSDSCDPNQFCSPSGICDCNPGTTLFAGECETLAHHGEHCTKQIHCSLTRDPNLHCLSKDGSSSQDRICQCRNGYQLDGDLCQSIPGYSPGHNTKGRISSHEVERPSHISLSRPQSKLEDGIVDLRSTNLSQIFNRKYEKTPHKLSIFGPVVLVSTCFLIFALCLCFWTVKRPEDVDEERRLNTRVLAHQKYLANQNGPNGLEDKLNIGHPDMEKGFAHDNPCYQGDNMDTLSHFTSNTDICETSHQEYNETNPTEHAIPANGISDVMGLSAQAQGPSPVIKNKLTDRNVKMLFVNDQQQASLTPSMDEADHEVAGIYKTYSSLNPLTVRMDSLSTPPPLPPPPKEPHVIELVETPDCTSIDTTLQEDLKSNGELIKDESTMDGQRRDSKADEEPLKDQKKSIDEGIPEVDFSTQNHEQYSDFIENVFKPVFSIS